MGKRSCLTAISLAGVMAVSFPAAAMAASPEFARSEEEWESLRDHVLEYGEIPDLIAEYNATVQSNQYEYRRFINIIYAQYINFFLTFQHRIISPPSAQL